MMKKLLTAGLFGALTLSSVSAFADTYHHHYHHHYANEGCVRRNHKAGVIGAVGGGLGGAAIGGAITHGNPAAMLLGAGAGALTGNAIGRNSHRC